MFFGVIGLFIVWGGFPNGMMYSLSFGVNNDMDIFMYDNTDNGSVRTTSAEGSSGEGLRRDAQKTSQATTRE